MQISPNESFKKSCYFRINKQVQLVKLSIFSTQDSPLTQIQPAFMLFLLTNLKKTSVKQKLRCQTKVMTNLIYITLGN